MTVVITPKRGDSDPGTDDLSDGEIAIRKDTNPPKLFVRVGSNIREIGGGSGGDANQTLTTGDGISGANSGSDSNFTMAVEPAQTTITSIFATDLKIGEDDQTKIDFETANEIQVYLNNAKDFTFSANTFTALSGSSVVVPAGGLTIGSTAVSSTAAELNLLDGSSANSVVNSKAVIYGSSGELAGTLSTAAQTNVTSLGTLSTLTVDDITINGSTISDGGNFDLDIGGDMVIDVDGGQLEIKDAGTSHFKFDCDNNAFSIMDDADSGDLFGIIVDANGETSIMTEDDDGSNADLKIDVDGDLTLDCAAGKDIIIKENNGTYTPSADAHVATKKYVDDEILANAGGGTGNISFSDTTMSGNAMTLDAVGEIALDADDNGEVKFLDGGAHYATMQKNSTQGLKLTAGSESKVILTTDDTGVLSTTGHQWIQAHHFGISNLDNNVPVFISWVSSNSNQSDIANHRPLMPCAGRILKCLVTCRNSGSSSLATMTNGANDFELEFSGSSTFSDVGHGAGTVKIEDPGRIFENTSNYPVNLTPLQTAVDDGSAGISATLLGYTWAAGDTIVGKMKNHSGNSNQRASMTMLVEWTV